MLEIPGNYEWLEFLDLFAEPPAVRVSRSLHRGERKWRDEQERERRNAWRQRRATDFAGASRMRKLSLHVNVA